MNIKKIFSGSFPNLYKFLQEKKCEIMYQRRRAQNPEKYPQLLEKRYEKLCGVKMDINSPKTYSEKIQWLKLYDNNPLRTHLTDKVEVRKWIQEMIGDEYLIPVYGVYDTPDEIEWDKLPNQFVIKTNHSSGWNIVVKEKKELNLDKTKKKLKNWLKHDYAFWTEYEPHYSGIQPKILIEKYMEDMSGNLTDYKFLCFSGKPMFVWVDLDRFGNHKRNVYDLDWNLQPWSQFTYGINENVRKTPPENFEDMCHVANKLCEGFRHVRVDLYNVDGKVYFGEMTFTNGSGFERLYPLEYEKIIGDLIEIP